MKREYSPSEIEITEGMIEAGLKAVAEEIGDPPFSLDSRRLVVLVFLAMTRGRHEWIAPSAMPYPAKK